jgi:DNA-binding HxlR family transcriptional regulator
VVPKRTYGQMCPIARSLDVVGERWTLLVVRELLLGPKRFRDLLGILPAMGTNRLADRLKGLEGDGVVAKRVLPPPSGVQVYELTESGERLRPLVSFLGFWGMSLPFGDGDEPGEARAELLALGLASMSAAELSTELNEIYEFRVGEEQFHFTVKRGVVMARSGAAPVEPELRVQCDFETFINLATGTFSPTQAVRRGLARMEGDSAVFTRAFRILKFPSPSQEFRLVPV